ncbi:MAG TPA: hypothetical protein VFK13_14815 [Gemmatimonadaceae bacterium]|nr:hypothetical protein [Gemmatimonadaceae bacterium]
MATLWIIVMLGLIGLALSVVSRDALNASRNRIGAIQAFWNAEDCIARAHLAADSAAHAGEGDPSLRAWEMVDILAAKELPYRRGVAWTLSFQPAGATLDLNTADTALLGRVMARLGLRQANALVDALLDWRDGDDTLRPHGAERKWYIDAGRIPPRNGPLADIRELRAVKGFEHLSGLDSVFGVRSGRVVINRAPLVVVGALPGFGDEAVGRIADLRARGIWLTKLEDLESDISPAAREELIAHAEELAHVATMLPEEWILTCRGTSAASPVVVIVEERLARSGRRVAVVHRRSWVE